MSCKPFLLLLFVIVINTAFGQAGKPVPVIFDTDIAGYYDDVSAIAPSYTLLQVRVIEQIMMHQPVKKGLNKY